MTDRTWIAGAAGAWLDPLNWTPAGLPGPGDTLTVIDGAPTIAAGPVSGEIIRLLGASTLTAVGVTFIPGSAAMQILVRGDDVTATDAVIVSIGTTTFHGKILVEAAAGSLTIETVSDGTSADFVLGADTLLLVTQESRLNITGVHFTNGGLIEIEGVAQVAAGVSLSGKGIIEIDNGGVLNLDGALGPSQRLLFSDGTGRATIADIDTFEASVGLTVYGGNRLRIEDVKARSASYDDGMLTLYGKKGEKGAVKAEIPVELINGADLDPLAAADQTLSGKDFRFASDGDGGTIVTYAPRGPAYLETSLPVPIVAETGSTVALEDMLRQAFGTAKPKFEGMILMPASDLDRAEDYWGQPKVNGQQKLLSGWIVNGALITEPTKVRKGDDVAFLVGNNIGFPPHLRAQITDAKKGGKAAYLDYYIWTVDPAVAALVTPDGAKAGHPLVTDIIASAGAYEAVYGKVFNTELCNWIADNVAAAAGATMPLPNQLLEPGSNVEGGFWRIAYRGDDGDPVVDWNTLVQPGDIVRLQWATTGAGHTTTVLAVNADGTLKVYDNIDVIDNEHHIGSHDDVAYWKKTDPAGITIYRLDPEARYLINGTDLAEHLQGSVHDDLIRAENGADLVAGSIGDDLLRGGRGSDELLGGPGDDILFGGRYGDRLKGGDGADLFGYVAIRQSRPESGRHDVIRDFEHGVDRIDLSALNEKLAAKGKTPFHFIGDAPFSGIAGELGYAETGRGFLVRGDADGDGRADFAILVRGTDQLTADDFVL